MKKVMFLFILVFFVSLAEAQKPIKNQVITVNGNVFSGTIKSFIGGKIQFYDKPEGLNSTSLPIEEVFEIRGNIPDFRIESILKHNPDIRFSEEVVHSGGNKITIPAEMDYRKPQYKIVKTGGDLVSKASVLRLTGMGVFMVSSTIYATGALNDMDKETRNAIMIGSSIAGLGLYVAGEFVQINAGRKLKREYISLSSSQDGVGVALKF